MLGTRVWKEEGKPSVRKGVMEAYAGPCLLCPNSFCWSLALGGAVLRPVFDRSWSSSDFRPSAEVLGKHGVLEEQKSPSELAWGFDWCWDPQSITWILINLLSFSSSMKPEILPLLQSRHHVSFHVRDASLCHTRCGPSGAVALAAPNPILLFNPYLLPFHPPPSPK